MELKQIKIESLHGLLCPQDQLKLKEVDKKIPLPEKLFVLAFDGAGVDSNGVPEVDLKIVEYELKK